MRVKKFVPLTLENVGSEGKFFTDKVILKFICSMIAGSYIGLVVFGQLGLFLPSFITLPICVIIGLYITILLLRHWVLREKLLTKLFEKMDKYKVIETSEFCDVYTVTNNGVCMHESGHISVVIEINLGTTLGLDTQDLNNLYKCFEIFESKILLAGVSFKTYGLEYVRKTFSELDEQQQKILNSTVPNIADIMLVRNKYIRVYTQEAGRLDKVVYVLYTNKHNEESLCNLVRRVEPLFRHPNIYSFEILDDYSKLNKFGEEFFGVSYFDIDNKNKEDLVDVIKFEEV